MESDSSFLSNLQKIKEGAEIFTIERREKIIEVMNLTKYYGKFMAVDHINFSVDKGEIFGFLGPNGAGKTTTIRILTGVLKPSEGKIRIFGKDLIKKSIEIKDKIGIVPEMANPYIDLTAIQNLKLIGELYGMKKNRIKIKSEELLKLFLLWNKRDKKVRGFSKGMKQRLSLAMALLPDPQLLFLDEPTSGLDVMSARVIKSIIREENKNGKTIFMSTHNMEEANTLCTRVTIINRGKIIATGTPEEIKRMYSGNVIVEASYKPFVVDYIKYEFGDAEILGDKIRIRTDKPHEVIEKVVKYADERGLKIISLNTLKPSLEDAFLQIVGGKK